MQPMVQQVKTTVSGDKPLSQLALMGVLRPQLTSVNMQVDQPISSELLKKIAGLEGVVQAKVLGF